jgi:hypothetical protein
MCGYNAPAIDGGVGKMFCRNGGREPRGPSVRSGSPASLKIFGADWAVRPSAFEKPYATQAPCL